MLQQPQLILHNLLHILGVGNLDIGTTAGQTTRIQAHGQDRIVGNARGKGFDGLPILLANRVGGLGNGVGTAFNAWQVSFLVGGVVIIGAQVGFNDGCFLARGRGTSSSRRFWLLNFGRIRAVFLQQTGHGGCTTNCSSSNSSSEECGDALGQNLSSTTRRNCWCVGDGGAGGWSVGGPSHGRGCGGQDQLDQQQGWNLHALVRMMMVMMVVVVGWSANNAYFG